MILGHSFLLTCIFSVESKSRSSFKKENGKNGLGKFKEKEKGVSCLAWQAGNEFAGSRVNFSGSAHLTFVGMKLTRNQLTEFYASFSWESSAAWYWHRKGT